MNDFLAKLQNKKNPFIIAISGDSGSGKTTYSQGINRIFGPSVVSTITMDGYHKENRKQREISKILPLDPQANKLDLFKTHLIKLKQGESIELPIYNHHTGDFDKPISFTPTPIIIIEGLHSLYPEFLEYIDFSIYVDPDRDIKWEWKYDRDVKIRHHDEKPLIDEMLAREAAYKRWIDFQKTGANVVVKISSSKIKQLAKYEFIGQLPKHTYYVTMILDQAKITLEPFTLSFDMSLKADEYNPPFNLATVPSVYWGRKTTVIHIDGVIPQKTVIEFEKNIYNIIGIDPNIAFSQNKECFGDLENNFNATQLAQLIILYRFLEQLHHNL